jgi:uncharacterized protein
MGSQNMMIDLVPAFLVGLLGSLHCLGMCGPLVLAYSLQVGNGKAFWKGGTLHHAAFHSGRLLTYGFLGGLAAALFNQEGLNRTFSSLRGGMTLFAGILMVLMGIALLKIFALPRFFGVLSLPSVGMGRFLSTLLRSRNIQGKLGLGLAAGFLPCGLSWAMIVKAATAQQIDQAVLTMVSFGLGTAPLLFLTGFSASYISLKTRILGERLAALSIIIMGLFLVLKGVRHLV